MTTPKILDLTDIVRVALSILGEEEARLWVLATYGNPDDPCPKPVTVYKLSAGHYGKAVTITRRIRRASVAMKPHLETLRQEAQRIEPVPFSGEEPCRCVVIYERGGNSVATTDGTQLRALRACGVAAVGAGGGTGRHREPVRAEDWGDE